jgi:hypothetical protein
VGLKLEDSPIEVGQILIGEKQTLLVPGRKKYHYLYQVPQVLCDGLCGWKTLNYAVNEWFADASPS